MRKALSLLLLLITSVYLFAEEKELSWYVQEAEKAIDNEFYEKAVEILEEGKKNYPEALTLYRMAGLMYSQKELYRLALNEYLQVVKIDPEDSDSLYQIAFLYGNISENEKAVEYFEKLLGDPHYGETVISDLAWMYYKTRRFNEGERLLLEQLQQKFDRNHAHTLGTIYTGLYDYEQSKKYYLLSIEDAQKAGSTYFSAIAYYNLSLLENSYYNYEESIKNTRLSLESKERASGYIALSRLQKQQMDFEGALASLNQGEELDETPRSKINKASLYTDYGALSSAETLLKSIIKNRDKSWMYHFGIDSDEMDMIISKMFKDIYRGRYYTGRYHLVSGPLSLGKRFFSRGKALFLYRYHLSKFQNITLDFARKMKEAGVYFDADLYFMDAARGDASLFAKYLSRARDFEMSIAPRGEPYYLLEEGDNTKEFTPLLKALEMFDSKWEKEGMGLTYRAAIPLLRKRGEKKQAAEFTGRLYEINPGSLRPEGLCLPMVLKVQDNPDIPALKSARIYRWMSSSRNIFYSTPQQGTQYTLHLTITGNNSGYYSLYDKKGESILQNEFSFERSRRKDFTAALNGILNEIYAPRSDGQPYF